MFHTLTDPDRWRQLRGDYMDAARGCKRTLTDKNGAWGYEPDDPRVKLAVESWIHRARNAHAYALGRKPIIKRFLFVNDNHAYEGPLFAQRRD